MTYLNILGENKKETKIKYMLVKLFRVPWDLRGKSLTTYLVHVSHEKLFLSYSIYLVLLYYESKVKYDEFKVIGSVHPGLVLICFSGAGYLY